MRAEMVHYLSFDGNCAEAMKFYQEALGGNLDVMTFRHSPMAEQTKPEDLDRVLHARLQGDSWKIFASDIASTHYVKPNPMVQISLNMYTAEESDAAFEKLSAGGQIFMPLQKTFWAEKFGMFADKYGFSWTINYEAAA